jgi:hypothetical protein
MSTTRIINGIEYTIPPGTEHVWTPPEQVVITPAIVETSSEELLERLGAHQIVRNQNSELIQNRIDELTQIWEKFKANTINSNQLAEELSAFRTEKLVPSVELDDITVQAFEEVMVNIMKESTSI